MNASRSNVLVGMVVALVLAGCASMSAPPTPITSISQIEGKWRGTITLGFAGPQELYYLTINPDGNMTAQWGPNWQWGKVTVENGAATFDMQGVSGGTITYSPGPRTRSLSLNSTFGNWSAYVTPLE
jgi:hypothetical protein